MGLCTICANLKSTKTNYAKKDACQNILKEHRDSQDSEQMKAMHHRDKALRSPSCYMCLMIDGMDQEKTCLPHFTRIPKDV
jgi:hypothetical protein